MEPPNTASPDLPRVTIYTDGGCRPNPGPGGWGAVLLFPGEKPVELSGHEEHTTNNRMELTAALEALRSLPAPHRAALVTDSEYLRKGITTWLHGWKKRGWKTASKTPVKNQDLWQALDAELERHEVSWEWTKGHAGDRWNERADRLAARAIGRPELPLDDIEAVHLFTAVAFSGKRGAGSWAVVLSWRGTTKEVSGRADGASANRLHIISAIEGLRQLKRRSKVHLYTVSSYLKDGATTWIRGWKARGWMTRDGRPVSHRDLWLTLESLLERHDVQWHVVDDKAAPEDMALAKKVARGEIAAG
ncbi:MAG: ribonuclease HI [Acidobacteria bacterium]|nr:ribonuclease HI [Acidobacteriota bacterium]